MIRLLCAALAVLPLPLALAPAPAPANVPARAAVFDDKVLDCLKAWLKAFHAKKIAFTSQKAIDGVPLIKQFGLLPKDFLGTLTYEVELAMLLKQAVALGNKDAAALVLDFATFGLEGARPDPKTAPDRVRSLAEQALVGFKSADSKAVFLRAARGELRSDRSKPVALRAAGLRAIGLLQDATARATLEENLANTDANVRRAAVEALGLLADEAAVPALAAALDREAMVHVVEAILDAVRLCYGKHNAPDAADAAVLPPHAEQVIRTAIKALGRSSWRADMALVTFLRDYRLAEAIPALIDVLQRFADHPEQIVAGKLSGLLLHRTQDTLRSLTGAAFRADQPERWREFWNQEKDKLKVTARPPKADKAVVQDDESKRTVAGLFGIPVEGSRVVFIVDLSASMDFVMRGVNMPEDEKDAAKGGDVTRMHIARSQLRAAIRGAPATTKVNFVTFAGEGASLWEKDLMLMNDGGRKQALDFIDNLRATKIDRAHPTRSGTNTWAGLQSALAIRDKGTATAHDANVDEIFLVSDGAPSVGDVVDPPEILRLLGEANLYAKTRINAVFITSEDEFRNNVQLSIPPAEFMRRLAEQHGGKFVEFRSK